MANLMDRLKQRTGLGVSKSAKGAKAPAAKTTKPPAEGAKETDAPTMVVKSAPKGKKKQSALERMKAGKSVKSAKGKASTSNKSTTPPVGEEKEPAIDAKEPVGVNPPKNKRKTKKKGTGVKPAAKDNAATSPSVASGKPAQSLLLIGCYPVQGIATPDSLQFLLEDVKATVCKANGVTHWDFLEFGKGGAALAQALDAKLTEEGVPPMLYAEPFSSESRAVEQILLKHYDVVVRGLR